MPIKKPVIAILGGTGKEGAGLALRLASAGYKILIGSRHVDRASRTAENINHQLGINTVLGLTNLEAASQADISILTVVYSAHNELLESLKNVMGGKILVDATSRVDYQDPKPPETPSAASQAMIQLGSSARVVAAFQTVPARLLNKNPGQPLELDVLVCSDDIQAAEQVIVLVKAAGMRGYYAGPVSNANVVEGLTSILISINTYYGIKNASIKITGVTSEG